MNYDIDLKSLEQTVLNPAITSGTLFYLEAPGWTNSEVLLETSFWSFLDYVHRIKQFWWFFCKMLRRGADSNDWKQTSCFPSGNQVAVRHLILNPVCHSTAPQIGLPFLPSSSTNMASDLEVSRNGSVPTTHFQLTESKLLLGTLSSTTVSNVSSTCLLYRLCLPASLKCTLRRNTKHAPDSTSLILISFFQRRKGRDWPNLPTRKARQWG